MVGHGTRGYPDHVEKTIYQKQITSILFLISNNNGNDIFVWARARIINNSAVLSSSCRIAGLGLFSRSRKSVSVLFFTSTIGYFRRTTTTQHVVILYIYLFVRLNIFPFQYVFAERRHHGGRHRPLHVSPSFIIIITCRLWRATRLLRMADGSFYSVHVVRT